MVGLILDLVTTGNLQGSPVTPVVNKYDAMMQRFEVGLSHSSIQTSVVVATCRQYWSVSSTSLYLHDFCIMDSEEGGDRGGPLYNICGSSLWVGSFLRCNTKTDFPLLLLKGEFL